MNYKKMFGGALNRRFILKTTTMNYRLVISASSNFSRSIHYAKPGERFDERVLQYIRTNPSFSESTVNTNHKNKLDEKVRISLDNFFDRKNFEKSLKKVLPASSIKRLPYYILEVGKMQDNNSLGILSLCDFHCSKIPVVNQHLQFKENYLKFSSLKILDAWMHILEHYYLVAKLQCYPVLIQQSAREITGNSISKSLNAQHASCTSGVIHLAFVASLGKKNLFESHEVLSQLALYCEENPEVTYKTWNELETAVMCSSFFRSGIKIQCNEFLQEISSMLSKNLETYLCSSAANTTLDVSIVISLLKVLRQANFVDDRILSCVRKLILDKDKGDKILMGNVTVLSHLMSAFSSSPCKKQMTLDTELVAVLNRAEKFVNSTLRVRESAEAKSDSHLQSQLEYKRKAKKTETDFNPTEKIRLKDISRWLWTAAILGYQHVNLEAYDADFCTRFSVGEFYEEIPAAIEALLALSIMNHYPKSTVTKVLQSFQFRDSLKVRCNSRQKVRFALFLSMVKIECNDVWRKLSPQQKANLEHIAPTAFWNKTQGWKAEPYRDTKNEKYPSHFCDMINLCMDSLNKAIQSQQTEPNKSGTDLRKMHRSNYNHNNNNVAETSLTHQTASTSTCENEENVLDIYRGCAVPYLFIPGIKISFLATGKTVYVELVDTESFSVGFLQMKLRIVSQLGHGVLYVTPEEIQQCPDLGKFFVLNITRLLQSQ